MGGHHNLVLRYLFLVVCVAAVGARHGILEVLVNGWQSRTFFNSSLGYNYHFEEMGHQCSAGQPKVRGADGVPRLSFTANRRSQEASEHEALLQRQKLAVVLAVGGHADSHYNYGPGGSINGLLAVWDSWLEYFFSPSSNTTSLILLFDARDFRRQNITTDKGAYLDHILVNNMGAQLADCAHFRPGRAGMHGNHGGGHQQGHHRFAGTPHYRPGFIPTTQMSSKSGSGTNATILGCSPNLPLDEGYRVYYVDIAQSNYTRKYKLKGEDVEREVDYSHQRPLVIFAAVHNFPKPPWAEKEDEDELFRTWKPWRLNRRYPTNYGYVKMTNWYSYYMLRLQILDFFDYAAKLDNDVSFVAPFPHPNLPYKMASGRHYMLMTTQQWYTDDPRISQGVGQCLTSFVHEEARHCKLADEKAIRTISLDYNPWSLVNHNMENQVLRPGGGNDTTFFERSYNNTFRAHFLVYWLGLYTAPETMLMARYWNDFHPRGMWDYRWGDQQWWPRPIAMLGAGNLAREIYHATDLESDNERFVVHKLWPRQGTVPKVQYYDPVKGTTRTQRDELYRVAAKPFLY